MSDQASTNTPPLVSVCIPVYNGEKTIAQTVASVLQQSYPNVEIIIQDNQSTDGTWSLLNSFAKNNPQISLEQNQKNLGMAANWNVAINRAKGEYIMLLSADDLLEPLFLKRCIDILKNKQVDAASTNHFYLQEGRKWKRKMRLKKGIYAYFPEVILFYNPFSVNFTLFSKQIINQIKVRGNLFARSLLTCDYDLEIRFSLSGAKIHYLADDFLGAYRIHALNLSRQHITRMPRQTALVVFAHKKELKRHCMFTYRFTLLRFFLRGIRELILSRPFDKRLSSVLLREILN